MYIFQLGRDGDISTLEIIRVLESITGELPEIMRYDKFILIKDELELDTKFLASKLAGTLKIAKVFHVSKTLDKNFINSLDFYFPKNFEIYITSENEELGQSVVELLNEFKKENKSRGSVLISGDTKIKPFAGEFEKVKDEICEIIVLKNNDEYFFAQVEAYADPNEFKFKDEARPVQKFTHGTSPRVAKMMVNILALDPGETMVDPFCGIGTFLVEGLIAQLKVIGIDNDQSIVSSAQNNVAWARKQFNLTGSCKIICSDSTHEIFRADGCVFEPYMGPFMKKLPSLFEATKVKTYLEKLYTATFWNLKGNLRENAEVVCIIPYFQTIEGKMVRINTKVFTDNGFEAEIDPIEYNTPDGSTIMRNLWLLQKT